MKSTKIVATISDKRCDPGFIAAIYNAGVNVVRVNSAHASIDALEQMVNNVRSVSPYIAVMIDTKGPEIRTTALADSGALRNPVKSSVTGHDKITFVKGESVDIVGNPDALTTNTVIYVNYRGIADALHPGDHVLIDDGVLDFEVVSIDGDRVHAVVCNTGQLGSRKTVNIPGVDIDLPSVSDRDRLFITRAAELGVDFVAHSFVRSRTDVDAVQAVLDECHSDMRIIAKIENQQGVDNFDSILDACYGVMIARGDLGIEVAAERIPAIQRMMISKCIAGHKPVIVATQMLHSMISSPRPTRAEVTDVAEAAYQQADALMLSGETASGQYPVEAVETMARIAAEVERTMANAPKDAPTLPDAHVTSFLARQAVMSEIRVGTKAIVTDAFHGRTARFIASFRGLRPVFAICNKESVARRLALSYGITPYYYDDYQPTQRYPVEALRKILADGRLDNDDRIAYLGSLGGVGATFLEIHRLSDIISFTDNPDSRLN